MMSIKRTVIFLHGMNDEWLNASWKKRNDDLKKKERYWGPKHCEDRNAEGDEY